MKVYFTASSSGSQRADREHYLEILRAIQSLGHEITNPYYAATVKDAKSFTNLDIKETDDVFDVLRSQIAQSDCVIAEISVPSTSLGIQIEYAITNKIPVLCLYKKGGNGDLPLMVRDYRDPILFKSEYTKQIPTVVSDFLTKVPKTRIKFNMFITYELDKYLSYLAKKEKSPKSEIVRKLLQDKMKTDKGFTS